MKDRFRLPGTRGSRETDEPRRPEFVDDAPLAVVICAPDGVILQHNAAFTTLLGHPSEASLRGRSFRDLLYPDDVADDMLLFRDLVTGQRNPYQKETRLVGTAGTPVWCLITAFPTGQPVEGRRLFAAILDDISERKAQEARERDEGVDPGSVARALLEASTIEEAAPPLLQMVAQSGGWDMAFLWRPGPGAGELQCTASWVAHNVECPAFVAITRERPFPIGVGLPGHVWQERKPLWYDDLSQDDNVVRTLKATREGLSTGFAFPITVEGEAEAVVELYSRENRPEDEKVAATLAAQGLHIARFFERERAEASIASAEQKFDTLTAIATEAIVTIGEDDRILEINPSTERIFGYSREELIGQPLTILMPENMREAHLNGIERFRTTGMRTIRWDGLKLPGRTKDGEKVELEIHLTESVRHGTRTFTGVMRDVTEQRAEESALAFHALHDPLTGLPNRTLLHDRLAQAVLVGERNGAQTALLSIDLNDFKSVNDTFGIQRGDALLQEVAARLQRSSRESDTLARMSGDDFALLLPSTSEDGAINTALRIMDAMKEPFFVDLQRFELSAAIGIAVHPEHGENADDLLKHADDALHAAKRASAAYTVYAARPDDRASLRLLLSSELREAIHDNQLRLYYQPKVDLKTGKTEHVEALVRWQHPQRGFIPPDGFIPLAEETGLITPMTVWVINEALRQHRTWFDLGYKVRVAVNISARSLNDPHLVETISRLLRSWNVEPSYLVAEVTESAIMIDPERALETLKEMRSAGLLIGIDDFGTGYSSLNYLKKLPADELKIDKSFVLDMATERDDASIVRSVVGLGHNLGMEVVAEGVDNKRSLDMLTEMDCDMAQGFFLSRPIPGNDLTEWLSASSARQILNLT